MKPVARKLLIIDDDRNITNLLAHHFGKEGFDVTVLNDPAGAMMLLREEGFRVLLLDIDMPGKSGLDLLTEIMAYDAATQVVMITGQETLGNLTSAFYSGAEYIAIKPLTDLSKLQDVVQRCFEKLDHWVEAINAVRSKEAGRT